MPLARIEILKGRPSCDRQQLLDAVHDALVEAFSIPEDDRIHRIVEHDPENFEIPPGASQRYTLIEITAFPGRSATAKRSLYGAIVRNLATAGVPAHDILAVLHEPPMENWGIRGGKPANDEDLGYRVDV
jgi:phenylpyruvate tautomerase PptA (4-oxalocrotonate tautomerase family)